MRVLHINAFPGWDGHHNRVVNECVGLAGLGWDVSVASRVEKVRDRCAAGGVSVVDYDSVLQRLGEFDIIHTHDSVGMLKVSSRLSRMRGKKPRFVAGIHFNMGLTGAPVVLPDGVDAAVAVSEYDHLGIVEANPDMVEKTRTIYTGVNPRDYGAADRDVLKVGCYAGDAHWKGRDVLIAAAKELPGIDFEVIGDPGVVPEDLPDNVTLLGHVEDVAGWLSGIEIYVQPSRAESLGTTLIEACASWCACIGSGVGGIPEVIRPSISGTLVDPDDPGQIVTAILAYKGSRALRDSYAAGARSMVEKQFTIDQMVAQTSILYGNIGVIAK